VQYIQPQHHARLAQAELLVIDEAAAIPLPLVRAMLGPYLVFLCSTVNGYEGAPVPPSPASRAGNVTIALGYIRSIRRRLTETKLFCWACLADTLMLMSKHAHRCRSATQFHYAATDQV